MMDQKIYDYIRRRRAEGKSDEEIRLTLLSLGFPTDDVNQVFQQAASTTKEFSREDLLHSVILLLLIVIFSVLHYVMTNFVFKVSYELL